MLLFVLFGLLILLLTLLLHYRQHFRFHVCTSAISSKRLTSFESIEGPIFISTQQLLRNKKCHAKCRCNIHLTSTDGEQFDFFPFSFFFYCIFIIFLSIILIIKWIISYYSNSNPFSLYITESLHNNNSDDIVSYIFDYILIYGIMILSIWESLFSFYRYYTTKISSKTCRLISTKRVLTRFIVYMIAFIVIFNIQIHFYLFYWIFPLIILFYAIFNIYCNLAFASILIVRYKQFLDIKDLTDNNNINQDILNSVYFMKRISLISNILSTFCLSVFLYFDNMNITYYLPILWSISCFIFCLNFIRNYKWIQQEIIIKCKRFILCCNCCNYFDLKTVKISTRNNESTQIPSIETRDGEDTNNTDDILTETKTNYDRFNELIQTLHPQKRDGPPLNIKSYSENNLYKESDKNGTPKLYGKSISAQDGKIKRNKSERETLLLQELWDEHCQIDDDNDNDNDNDNDLKLNPISSIPINMNKRVVFKLNDSNINKKQKAKSYDIDSKQSNKLKTNNLRLSRGGKALEVLGLTPSNSINNKKRYLDATTHKSKSHGIIGKKTSSKKLKIALKGRSAKSQDSQYINMIHDNSPNHDDENDEYHITKRKRIHLKRKSLSNNRNNENNTIQEEDSNIHQMFEMFDYSDGEEEVVGNLDFIISSKKPLRNVVSAPNMISNPHLKIPGLKTLDINGKNKSNELSESGMVYTGHYDIDYHPKNELETTPDLVTDDDDDDIDQEWKDNNDRNNDKLDIHSSIQHNKNKKSMLERFIFGDNKNNDKEKHKQEIPDLDEMMIPLNLMAKYGLISKKSINSVHQIKMYQKNNNQHHGRSQTSLQIIDNERNPKPTLNNLGFSAKQ